MRLLNALNSEDRGLKVHFSLATIAFDRESAQVSQMLSSQGKKRTFKPLSSLFSEFGFSQNDFGKFLRGGYPNRSSGIHR